MASKRGNRRRTLNVIRNLVRVVFVAQEEDKPELLGSACLELGHLLHKPIALCDLMADPKDFRRILKASKICGFYAGNRSQPKDQEYPVNFEAA